MESNVKYFLDKVYICNFKPFAYIDEKKPYFEIDFNNSNSGKTSIIFSGPNGYGKSSIFQAIEFALMGYENPKSYKDKIRSIGEHIYVNNLDKPCFVALQLRSYTDGYITIVRYTEKGIVGSTVENQRYANDFSTYILYAGFDYDDFIKKIESGNIASKDKNEVSVILGENVDEWLRRNYISQEHGNAFIMQKDNDRVDVLKSFIDSQSDEYFQKYYDEKAIAENKCKILEESIRNLYSKINIEIELINGEEPECGKVIEYADFVWDKEEYKEDEPFSEYLNKAKNALKFVSNIREYAKYRGEELLQSIKAKQQFYLEYILYSFDEKKLLEYKTSFEKRTYLSGLLESEEAFFNSPINRGYLSAELIEKIENLRGKKREFQGLLDEQQRVYKKFENLHNDIQESRLLIAQVFDDKCPLCGNSYKHDEHKLAERIENTSNLFSNMQSMLNSSLSVIDDSISAELKDIKRLLEIEISKEQNNVEIYNAIQKLDKNLDTINTLKKEVNETYGICSYMGIEIVKYFSEPELFKNHFTKLEEAFAIEEEFRNFINTIVFEKYNESSFDMQVYQEYKNHVIILQNEVENIDIIQKKIRQLEWLTAKQEANIFSRNKSAYEKFVNEYKEQRIRILKIDKILACQKNAKKRYMENIAKYLEIPLYIYSGKLMQTSQNELGITCYTGDREYELTQFKLTSGLDSGKQKLDITEKFSSGQKAVANIALILALKKIATTNIDIFMIDDPCQTLDELNIASFVEIMKNEFKDTQLILSTHEDKIAAYIKYKFEKAGKHMELFNVQEKIYNRLNG